MPSSSAFVQMIQLTHCGLMTHLISRSTLDQIMACCLTAPSELSSTRPFGIHSRLMLTWILKISLLKLCLEFTSLKLQQHTRGDNELIQINHRYPKNTGHVDSTLINYYGNHERAIPNLLLGGTPIIEPFVANWELHKYHCVQRVLNNIIPSDIQVTLFVRQKYGNFFQAMP